MSEQQLYAEIEKAERMKARAVARLSQMALENPSSSAIPLSSPTTFARKAVICSPTSPPSPPAPPRTPAEYQGASGTKSSTGHTAAVGGKRGHYSSFCDQEQPFARLQRSDAVHYHSGVHPHIAESISPLDRLTRQVDRIKITTDQDNDYNRLYEQVENNFRHPKATLPPRRPERHYPPSSYFMNDTDGKPQSGATKDVPELSHLRQPGIPAVQLRESYVASRSELPTVQTRGRHTDRAQDDAARAGKHYQYPAAAPHKKHRRRSSAQRVMDFADQTITKSVQIAKEGVSKMRESIVRRTSRSSTSSFRVHHIERQTAQPVINLDPSTAPTQHRRTTSNPNMLRPNLGAPKIARKPLPPAALVHDLTIFFTKCPHVSPPSSLPLNSKPKETQLTETTLRYLTQWHKQHLRARSDNVDMDPTTIWTVEGRCADCDLNHRREQETHILAKHAKQIPSTKHQCLRDLETELNLAMDAGEQEQLREGLVQDVQRIKSEIATVEAARDKAVKKVWKGFRQRWGPAAVGAVRTNGAEIDSETIASSSTDSSKSDETIVGATGFGYLRRGKHGKEIETVREDGRMRLSWQQGAEKKPGLKRSVTVISKLRDDEGWSLRGPISPIEPDGQWSVHI